MSDAIREKFEKIHAECLLAMTERLLRDHLKGGLAPGFRSRQLRLVNQLRAGLKIKCNCGKTPCEGMEVFYRLLADLWLDAIPEELKKQDIQNIDEVRGWMHLQVREQWSSCRKEN